jgi:hypothetical protein
MIYTVDDLKKQGKIPSSLNSSPMASANHYDDKVSGGVLQLTAVFSMTVPRSDLNLLVC